MIELIVTVCATAHINVCEEQHLQFAWAGSVRQCALAAPPYIAQWIVDHPKWMAMGWRCEEPARRKENT